MVKIVVLDGFVANSGDLHWNAIDQIGELTVYERTPNNLIVERASDAEIILTNKCIIDKKTMDLLPKLKYIGLLATGYNNIDVEAAKAHDITVCNASGYSTYSVAQHVFALLFSLTNHVAIHHQSVAEKEWSNSPDWSYRKKPLIELSDKVMGIIGLGNIGSQVANIALALGMKVLATKRNMNSNVQANVKLVDSKTIFETCDVISLHVPLNNATKHIVNKDTLQSMKENAIIINTGRGPLINEDDLHWALENDIIAGAGLDVLTNEPPKASNPLLQTKNCIITPHIAWATKESRKRLLEIVAQNIRSYLDGSPNNVVT